MVRHPGLSAKTARQWSGSRYGVTVTARDQPDGRYYVELHQYAVGSFQAE
jgi:hypothetical protein